MTTIDKRIHNLIFGFDCDGLPAASDVELAAADRANARARSLWPDDIAELTPAKVFNSLCTKWGITGDDRSLFHEFAKQRHVGRWTWVVFGDLWHDFYNWGREAIIAAEDARDLRDTQQDALT